MTKEDFVMAKFELQPVPEAKTAADTNSTKADSAVDPIKVDKFSPENLRLDQSFTEMAGVKKLLLTIPIRKPSPQEFVWVHPSPEYRDNFPIIDLKDDREEYLVAKDLVPELIGEFVPKTLFLAINRQGTLFFWPVRLPSSDSKQNRWWTSLREAAELCMTGWHRVKANQNLGAYDVFKAMDALKEPEWPKQTFYELIQIAFRDYLIDRIDHAVIKRLRGLA
jgi:hypothetical protein